MLSGRFVECDDGSINRNDASVNTNVIGNILIKLKYSIQRNEFATARWRCLAGAATAVMARQSVPARPPSGPVNTASSPVGYGLFAANVERSSRPSQCDPRAPRDCSSLELSARPELTRTYVITFHPYLNLVFSDAI
ncbi:hypothetical protein ACJJTC_009906 [Scirpophaga incertulas]